jgi:hypothetical protein
MKGNRESTGDGNILGATLIHRMGECQSPAGNAEHDSEERVFMAGPSGGPDQLLRPRHVAATFPCKFSRL